MFCCECVKPVAILTRALTSRALNKYRALTSQTLIKHGCNRKTVYCNIIFFVQKFFFGKSSRLFLNKCQTFKVHAKGRHSPCIFMRYVFVRLKKQSQNIHMATKKSFQKLLIGNFLHFLIFFFLQFLHLQLSFIYPSPH